VSQPGQHRAANGRVPTAVWLRFVHRSPMLGSHWGGRVTRDHEQTTPPDSSTALRGPALPCSPARVVSRTPTTWGTVARLPPDNRPAIQFSRRRRRKKRVVAGGGMWLRRRTMTRR
jgi:hypothetical protein